MNEAPNDGWRIVHEHDGFHARYLPDADAQESWVTDRGPFATLEEATTFALGNYTTRGVVQP